MKSRARRVLEGALGLLALAAAVVWLSGGFEPKVGAGVLAPAAEQAAQGSLHPVEEVVEGAREWVSGEVSSARQTAVAARVLARIEQVHVRAGSSVAEGDVLVTLDARDLRARVGEAEEGIREARAALDLARRDHARAEELVRTGVAPQRRLDQTRSELAAAEARAAGAGDALEEARAAASFAEIRSPVSGQVVDRLAEPGDTAVPGRPLLRVYDPTLLRVDAPVRESLAIDLSVGDVLDVAIPALERGVEGRIDEIVPFAERGTRTLLVKVSLPRTDGRLFAGMFARVAIPAGERRRLLIPEAALQRVGQLEFVTVVADSGQPERRLVTSGESASSGRVEVLSGLRAGERVSVRDDAQKKGGARREAG